MILMLFWEKKIWRENGRGRHTGAEGSRVLKPYQKVGPLSGTFGSTFISKKVFENLGPEPPPLNY